MRRIITVSTALVLLVGAVPIGARLTLTPGVRYRALSRDVEIGGVASPVDLRYVTVGMGVAYQF